MSSLNNEALWFYLRNRPLYWTTRITPIKVLAFLPVSMGLVGFVTAPMRERKYRILAPMALALIVVFPLIEPRYYLVVISLFLAFRKLENTRWEWINTASYMGLSLIFEWGIVERRFFL